MPPMDKLSNFTSVTERDDSTVSYTVDNLSNRYSAIGPDSLDYDNAGNLTLDADDYEYEYDYENRIVKITKNSTTIAEYAYDALGRRIRKIAGGATRLYYYNDKNQVLTAFDDSATLKEWNVFGNYIDELLLAWNGYCIGDNLYSIAALVNASGTVLERYEYGAYGQPTVYNADYSSSYDQSQLANPQEYLFTGRRVDFLDSGNLKLQYNRNRYYSYNLRRWLTQDPLGITPNPQSPNYFQPIFQYSDGLNIYE